MSQTYNYWIAEFFGTMMMVLILNAAIASEHLKGTYSSGQGRGYLAWGILACVIVPVIMFGKISGMFNPAVTLAKYVAGVIPFSKFLTQGLPDIVAQILGAMMGALIVTVFYWDQFKATKDSHMVGASYFTSAKIENKPMNFLQEAIGTFVLVFAVLGIEKYYEESKSSNFMVLALILGLVVVAAVFITSQLSPAINPARDLGPRIIHALLPIPNKGKSNWSYAWVPFFGPIAGGVVAALLFRFVIAPMWTGVHF